MFCSRDARQVLNQISEKSGRDNFSASDVISAEEIIYQYLPSVAASVVKSRYPKKSKPRLSPILLLTLEYHRKSNMFTNLSQTQTFAMVSMLASLAAAPVNAERTAMVQ